MNFHIASAFYALIIGKKGATKKRIEGETKARIFIPKQVRASACPFVRKLSGTST